MLQVNGSLFLPRIWDEPSKVSVRQCSSLGCDYGNSFSKNIIFHSQGEHPPPKRMKAVQQQQSCNTTNLQHNQPSPRPTPTNHTNQPTTQPRPRLLKQLSEQTKLLVLERRRLVGGGVGAGATVVGGEHGLCCRSFVRPLLRRARRSSKSNKTVFRSSCQEQSASLFQGLTAGLPSRATRRVLLSVIPRPL